MNAPEAKSQEENRSEPRLRVVEPRVDLRREADRVCLFADLPGAREADIRVDLDREVLNLSARVETQEPTGLQLLHREYAGREYRRAFRIGPEVDRSGIKASIRHGVLRLDLPFRAETRPRRVDIEIA